MQQRCLVLLPDGDIVIFDLSKGKRIYHKSYNCGDNLHENLNLAFDAWEGWDVIGD